MAYLFQMSALDTFRDVNGDLMPLSTLSFYDEGSTVPASTYTDETGNTEHEWPVEADVNGVFPAIYLDADAAYRVKLKDADGNTLRDRDNIKLSVPGNIATDAELAAIEASLISDMDALEAEIDALQTTYNVKNFGAIGNGVTDDTAAVQAAVDEAAANGGGTIQFPDGTYIIAGALQDTSLSNSQIVLPKVTDVTTGMVIQFEGITPPGNTFSSESGAILKSTLSSGSGAMIGVKTASFDVSRISFYARNLTFRMVENPTNSCLDLRYIPFVHLENVRVDVPSITAGTAEATGPEFDVAEPTHSTSFGIMGPLNNVPTRNIYNNVGIFGYYYGIRPGELWGGDNLTICACKWPIQIFACLHAAHYGYILVCNSPNTIQFDNTSGGGRGEIHIGLLDVEHDTAAGSGPSWVEPHGYDFDDDTNNLCGEINLHMHDASIPITKNGAQNLKIERVHDSYPVFPIWGSFLNLVDATSVHETRTDNSATTMRVDLTNQTATSEITGGHLVGNLALAGSDYRLAGYFIRTNGATDRGRIDWGTANGGAYAEHMRLDHLGNFGTNALGTHVITATENSDFSGILAQSSATTVVKTFTRAFVVAPNVVVTPLFDLGAGVRWWVTRNTTTFTINTSASVSGDWAYVVIAQGG